PEKFKSFAAEIDSLREQIARKLGKEDVDYIKQVKKISRFSEILGRSLIHFSLDPFPWSAGVFTLWIHKQLDIAEIGHSALHGCWDGLIGAEEFYSASFSWNTPIEEESWKRGHNQLHHNYTNVVGRDPDVNFAILRISEKTPWAPHNLFQIGFSLFSAPLFSWALNFYFTGLGDLFRSPHAEGYTDVLPDRKLKTILGALGQSAKKLVPYFLYNYGLWPLLAGPFWGKVFAGNFTADVMRNLYSWATIYAGHFGDDLEYYDPSFRPKGRGQWYKSQVEAAHDYKVPQLLSIFCGALDCQIEHHLFPELPPNRLREIRPRVQQICERYGVRYHKAGWGSTLKKSLLRIARMSLPTPGVKNLKPEPALIMGSPLNAA